MTGEAEYEDIGVLGVDQKDLAFMKEPKRLQTTGSSYVSPGLFEKLYSLHKMQSRGSSVAPLETQRRCTSSLFPRLPLEKGLVLHL